MNKVFLLMLFLIRINVLFATNNSDNIDLNKIFPKINNWDLIKTKEYDSNNLYEAIDGAADVFFEYNFVRMLSAEYDSADKYIYVEIYQHSTPEDAFGIYSTERPDRDIYINIGLQGYAEDEYINFVSSNYYIKIRAISKENNIKKRMFEIAYNISNKIKNKNNILDFFRVFPEENKVKYSEKFIRKNVMGYSFLNSSYEVSYEYKDSQYTIFIMKTKDKDASRLVVEKYASYLKESINNIYDIINFKDNFYGTISLFIDNEYIIGVRGNNPTQNKTIIESIKERLRNIKQN